MWPGTIKQYGETINILLNLPILFLTLFLYFFISLQILSVCLMYILYIFIYQYNATPKGPHRLKRRPEQWQEPSQPRKWTIGPLA